MALIFYDRNQLVPFRNDDFVTDEVTSVKGILYENHTGLEVEDKSKYQKYADIVKNELELSDKVVYGDWLRFH